mmetsp:Transcript_88729/g.206499  ORF Transcript_88729/g.206499 Transcript_88729/m.206499 type:complete len:353 (+) Transcript_88729:1150-2208(+)
MVSYHVLRLPPRPCADNLVAVIHAIGLDASAVPLALRVGPDNGDLLRRVVAVIELAHFLEVAILGNVVVGHFVLQVTPHLLHRLLPLLFLLRHGTEVLPELPVLFAIHLQAILPVHGASLQATPVVEAPPELVDLHEVVGVELVGPRVNLIELATDGLVVKLHPRRAIDILDVGPRVLIDGLAVELDLPCGERQHPWDVVPADLVHAGGRAGAVGEDDADATQRLLPLAHDDGADVEEGGNSVARADDLQQVHGAHQAALHELLSLLMVAIGVIGSAHPFEGLLDNMEATTCVEDVEVRRGEEWPVVHLLLQHLVAHVNAGHVGVDAVLAVHNGCHGPPAHRFEEVESVQDA